MTSSLLPGALLACLLFACGKADDATPTGPGAAEPSTGQAAAPANEPAAETTAPASTEDDAEQGSKLRGTFTYVKPGRKVPRMLSNLALVEALLQRRTEDGGWEEVARHDYYTMGRQVPLGFAIPYEPAAIDPEGDYQVIVRISEGMYTIFESSEGTPVLTKGHPAGAVREELTLQLEAVKK